MSLNLIVGLLFAVFFVLIAIAYINNLVENNRLKASRKRALLADLIRRCGIISLSLPEQMMTAKLRKTLVMLELHWSEQLLICTKNSPKLRERISRLQEQETLSDNVEKISPNNPSIKQIQNEARFNEARYLLEDLYSLIATAGKDALLSAAEVKYWHQDIRRLSALLYLEYLGNLGEIALQRNQLSKARQLFEQAVTYLAKKSNFPDRENRNDIFEQYIIQIDQKLQENGQKPSSDNELAEEVKNIKNDSDALWHKKNFYE